MAYENGAWVAVDLNEARKWYSMASKRGNPVAKRKLAELSGKR
jgi:TPR repeat protein